MTGALAWWMGCTTGPEGGRPPPPPAGPPDRSWYGENRQQRTGHWVDAIDSDLAPAPIAIGEDINAALYDETGWNHVWRVSSDSPSGLLEDHAEGQIVGNVFYTGRFTPDLSGDETPELLVVGDSTADLLGFDASLLGTVPRSDAWLRAAAKPAGAVLCGDVDGDGREDFCSTTGDRVAVWFGPLETSFSDEDPDLEVLMPLGYREVIGRMAGGVAGTGRGTLIVSWEAIDEGKRYITVLRAGVTSIEAGETVEAPPTILGKGDLTPDPGEELILTNGDRLEVYTAAEGVQLGPTGFVLDASSVALDTSYARHAATGDFDGDGAQDLAVSSAGTPHYVFLFRGPLAPGTVTFDDADLCLRSTSTHDEFGSVLASADVDGDGQDDLVVGAPSDDTHGEDAGAAHLWTGASLFP